jgi:hypothetical protein
MGRLALTGATVVDRRGSMRWSASTRRSAAAMVGVLVADTWPIGASRPIGSGAPIATAMVDLARAVTQPTTPGALGEVADRHDNVAAPAWLLPVAFAQTDRAQLMEHTLELVGRADVPTDDADASVAYVVLAAELVACQPVLASIDEVTDLALPADQPLETGRPASDGLAVGLWALTQSAGFDELLPRLAATSSRPVVAAASGLVALRDGLAAIRPAWYRHLHLTHECLALAQPLQEARQHACASTPQPELQAR